MEINDKLVETLIMLRLGNLGAYNDITKYFEIQAVKTAVSSIGIEDEKRCSWMQGRAQALRQVQKIFQDVEENHERIKGGSR